MPKRDLTARIDQNAAIRNGEIISAATVVQVSQLAMSSPFSGDFQIIDEGRLIVGENPDLGNRTVISKRGLFGYDNNGSLSFAAYTAGDMGSIYGAGDVFAGNSLGNYLFYDQSEGTFGLYSPAGAGFIASNDGSLIAGDTDGAHMMWNTASRALEIRSGEDVKISLDDQGNGSFDGTVYAAGGRIYGQMQVDGLLRVGDVDGPSVSMGKFERYDGSNLVESGEIVITDADNLPWFRAVAGGGTAYGGYLHVGAPGDYSGRMTYDGAELRVANWVVNSQAFVAPSGYVSLDTNRGVVFVGAVDDPPDDQEGLTSADARNYMLTFWESGVDDDWCTARVLAYNNTDTTPDTRVLSIQSQPLSPYRSIMRLSSFSEQEARTNVRAVGGYGTASQEITQIDLWAYRTEHSGSFEYRRIDFDTDAICLFATDIAAFGGTVRDGTIAYVDGSGFDPGAGEGLYWYVDAVWKPIRLAAAGWSALTAGTYTAGNEQLIHCNASGGAITLNLPAATAKPLDWQYTIIKSDSTGNTVTIDADGAATINGATTKVLSAQYETVTIRRYGANWLIIN